MRAAIPEKSHASKGLGNAVQRSVSPQGQRSTVVASPGCWTAQNSQCAPRKSPLFQGSDGPQIAASMCWSGRAKSRRATAHAVMQASSVCRRCSFTSVGDHESGGCATPEVPCAGGPLRIPSMSTPERLGVARACLQIMVAALMVRMLGAIAARKVRHFGRDGTGRRLGGSRRTSLPAAHTHAERLWSRCAGAKHALQRTRVS